MNNAAVFLEGTHTPLAELNPDWFAQTVSVNVSGVARVRQLLLPALCAAGAASVVNLSSGAGSNLK